MECQHPHWPSCENFIHWFFLGSARDRDTGRISWEKQVKAMFGWRAPREHHPDFHLKSMSRSKVALCHTRHVPEESGVKLLLSLGVGMSTKGERSYSRTIVSVRFWAKKATLGFLSVGWQGRFVQRANRPTGKQRRGPTHDASVRYGT